MVHQHAISSGKGNGDIDLTLLEGAQAYVVERQQRLRPRQDLTAAWQSFYSAYAPVIYRFAITCRVPPADLDDCVQEVWHELMLRLPAFRYDPRRGRFCSWLYTIVFRKATDQARRKIRRPMTRLADRAHEEIAGTELDPAVVWDRQSDRELVRGALEKLRGCTSRRTYLVLHMRWMEGRTIAEIACALNLTDRQVWLRHHRVKRKLRRLINRHNSNTTRHANV